MFSMTRTLKRWTREEITVAVENNHVNVAARVGLGYPFRFVHLPSLSIQEATDLHTMLGEVIDNARLQLPSASSRTI